MNAIKMIAYIRDNRILTMRKVDRNQNMTDMDIYYGICIRKGTMVYILIVLYDCEK